MNRYLNCEPRSTRSTRKLIQYLVSLSVYSVFSVVTNGAVPAGRWDLAVKGGAMKYAAWLEVGESGGTNTVRFVGRVASVRNIRQFELTEGALNFSENEYFSPYEKCAHQFAFAGDRVTGTITRPNGTVLGITGQRAPKLDRPAPSKWTAPRSLFNGRDFNGWQAIYGFVPPSNWRVENGEFITFKSGTPLRTTEVFDDFKLHIEFNCPTNANSGIYLRGRYEVQVEDDSIKAPPNQQTGGIYGWLGPDTPQPRRPGQWRTLDVTLVGRRATVALDGVALFTNREIPGITGEARDSDEAEPGPIILQASHAKAGGELRFRNVTVTTPDH